MTQIWRRGRRAHERGRGSRGGAAGRARQRDERPYFEVLVVDDIDAGRGARAAPATAGRCAATDDEFIYDVVVVPSFEDAIIAVLFNHNIQSCVLRYRFPVESRRAHRRAAALPARWSTAASSRERAEADPSAALAEAIKQLRPELDLFLVTDDTARQRGRPAGTRCFRRVFYRQEDYLELHLSILKGIRERYETPFFTALREYSQKPTGVFHALPISRGKSIIKLALDPGHGRSSTAATSSWPRPRRRPAGSTRCCSRPGRSSARRRRSRAPSAAATASSSPTAPRPPTRSSSRRWCGPGDIVLLSHDCHKSHHYALMLAGALPGLPGRVPAATSTRCTAACRCARSSASCCALKRAGKLDRVRMLLLTNCTFDGIVYDPERVMREVLAIKPDMIFLWDEAWFAFARCHADLPAAHGDGGGASACDASSRADAYRAALRGLEGRVRRARPGRRRDLARPASCCRTPTRRGCASTRRSRPTRR